jgi:mannosyl-oligosaccharide glucosidase
LGIPELVAAYDAKFRARLPVQFADRTVNVQSLENFSKAITSNLLGGIGYFYGPSIISDKSSYEWDSDTPDLSFDVGSPRLTDARSLFTATPSRSFFPRGFYW